MARMSIIHYMRYRTDPARDALIVFTRTLPNGQIDLGKILKNDMSACSNTVKESFASL